MTDRPVTAYGHTNHDWWCRCSCGWRGDRHIEEEAARDQAKLHSIELGHQPAWEQLWEEDR
jgi:hypothetical protein